MTAPEGRLFRPARGVRLERARDRGFGRALEARIHACLDAQVPVADGDEVGKLVDHPFGEITGRRLSRRLGRARARARRTFGEIQFTDLVFGHEAERGHVFEHLHRAGVRAFGTAERIEPRGRFEEPGEQRRLVERQLAGAGIEVAFRRRVDAVGSRAEIDAVEVHGQYFFLVEAAFEPERQHRLLDFPLPGAFGREKEVLGELLGDGRAALDGAASAQIRERGAGEPQEIEPEVLEEAAVLGRDDGERKLGRHLVERHRPAPDLAHAGELGPVGGEHDDHRGPGRAEGAVDVGQIVGEDRESEERRHHPPHPESERARGRAPPALAPSPAHAKVLFTKPSRAVTSSAGGS